MLLAGRYAIDRYQGKHYAMAQNLAHELRAAYDEALAAYDVLVMPTLPMRPRSCPKPDADREEVIPRALEMIANTCATDVTGHPACSVPAGPRQRPADRNDDRREALRRRHRPAGRAHLREGGRGLPDAAGLHGVTAG